MMFCGLMQTAVKQLWDLWNGCGIIYSCTGREEDGSVKAEISHGDRQKVISLLDKNGIRVYIIYERQAFLLWSAGTDAVPEY